MCKYARLRRWHRRRFVTDFRIRTVEQSINPGSFLIFRLDVLRYYGTYSRSNLSSCPTSHLIAIAVALKRSYQPQFSIQLFTILDGNRIFEISQYASSITKHALGIAIARVLYSASFIIFMYPMLELFFTYFPSDMHHCLPIG
jgi:hypothetical protein